MLIITKEPADNGAYPPIQTWPSIAPPDTHYQIQDGMDLSVFTQYNGFVYITVMRDVVVHMEPNYAAWEAWKDSLPPQPAPEPTALELMKAMLGVTE